MLDYYKNTDLLLEDINGFSQIKRLLVWELRDSLERVEQGLNSFSIIAGICYLPFFNHLFRFDSFSDFYFFESIIWSNIFIFLFFYPKKRKILRLVLSLITFLIWLIVHNDLLFQDWDFGFVYGYKAIQLGFYVYIITILSMSIFNYYKSEKAKEKIIKILETQN